MTHEKNMETWFKLINMAVKRMCWSGLLGERKQYIYICIYWYYFYKDEPNIDSELGKLKVNN